MDDCLMGLSLAELAQVFARPEQSTRANFSINLHNPLPYCRAKGDFFI